MLYEVMKSIKNFFLTGVSKEGTYSIMGGSISLPFVNKGEYFLIEGSRLNDGVFRYDEYLNLGLTDEKFDGRISVLAPPKAFLELVDEIKEFKANNKPSAMQSESFGGYTYSKASNAGGGLADWASAFRERLNTWRKI